MSINIKNMMNKNFFQKIFIVLWIVFSVLYILFDQYQWFKIWVIQGSYSAWARDAYNAIILESKKSCNSFNVKNETTSVDLISIECLKNNSNNTNTTTPVNDK